MKNAKWVSMFLVLFAFAPLSAQEAKVASPYGPLRAVHSFEWPATRSSLVTASRSNEIAIQQAGGRSGRCMRILIIGGAAVGGTLALIENRREDGDGVETVSGESGATAFVVGGVVGALTGWVIGALAC